MLLACDISVHPFIWRKWSKQGDCWDKISANIELHETKEWGILEIVCDFKIGQSNFVALVNS